VEWLKARLCKVTSALNLFPYQVFKTLPKLSFRSHQYTNINEYESDITSDGLVGIVVFLSGLASELAKEMTRNCSVTEQPAILTVPAMKTISKNERKYVTFLEIVLL
jgi:vacuolar-type H+-ATPase subunit F/Vma7